MPGIISGRAWLSDRRRFLEAELAKDPPPTPEQRTAIEAELDAVKHELGSSRRRWTRWVFWGARPPA